MKFDERGLLRHLGLHKKAAKSWPYQSIFWHCLNAYSTALALERLLPARLNQVEMDILRLTALLHDSGKAREAWQDKGHGPHAAITPELRVVLSQAFNDTTLFSEPPSEVVCEYALQLITEHHVRKTASISDLERVLSIVKLADKLTSSERFTAKNIDELWQLYQPIWNPIVLTAEEHPISYFALSLADRAIEDSGGKVLLTNPLQSLYLLPSSQDIEEIERAVIETVRGDLLAQAGTSNLFSALGSATSKHPVVDPYALWSDLNLRNGGRSRDELVGEVQRVREQADRFVRTRRQPMDPDKAWYPPLKLLYRISKDQGDKDLIGSNIPLSDATGGKRYPSFKDARSVAQKLGLKNPESFAVWAIDALQKGMKKPSGSVIDLDILTWSNMKVDARREAIEAYDYYKKRLWSSTRPTSWSSKPLHRRTADYCFSCKRRPPTRKAPAMGYLKIDTWTSSVSSKGPVKVCDLCFLARAHVLEVAEPSAFHVQLTPPYNQARLDWKSLYRT